MFVNNLNTLQRQQERVFERLCPLDGTQFADSTAPVDPSVDDLDRFGQATRGRGPPDFTVPADSDSLFEVIPGNRLCTLLQCERRRGGGHDRSPMMARGRNDNETWLSFWVRRSVGVLPWRCSLIIFAKDHRE